MNKKDREITREELKNSIGYGNINISDDDLSNKEISKGLFIINFLVIISFKVCGSGYKILKFIGGRTVKLIADERLDKKVVDNEVADHFVKQSSIISNEDKLKMSNLIKKGSVKLAQSVAESLNNKPKLK